MEVYFSLLKWDSVYFLQYKNTRKRKYKKKKKEKKKVIHAMYILYCKCTEFCEGSESLWIREFCTEISSKFSGLIFFFNSPKNCSLLNYRKVHNKVSFYMIINNPNLFPCVFFSFPDSWWNLWPSWWRDWHHLWTDAELYRKRPRRKRLLRYVAQCQESNLTLRTHHGQSNNDKKKCCFWFMTTEQIQNIYWKLLHRKELLRHVAQF